MAGAYGCWYSGAQGNILKIDSIRVRNFKIFDSLDLSFTNTTLGEIADRFMILGDNATGKTSLLQAISLPLVLATRSRAAIDQFDWYGFLPARYLKSGPPRIELEIRFTLEELEATREVARRWWETQPAATRRPFVEPGNNPAVRLVMDGNSWPKAGSAAELFQFSGRYYVTQLLKTDPNARDWYEHLPGVFFFDQYRNLAWSSPTPHEGFEDQEDELQARQTLEQGIASLRKHLLRCFSSADQVLQNRFPQESRDPFLDDLSRPLLRRHRRSSGLER